MAQITLHRADCSVWLQIEDQCENNGLTKCICLWRGLCGVERVSYCPPANSKPSHPKSLRCIWQTNSSLQDELRMSLWWERCFSFSWEWANKWSVVYCCVKKSHGDIRNNSSSRLIYRCYLLPYICVPSGFSLPSSKQLIMHREALSLT